MTYLILAESSLELVPPELQGRRAVLAHAKRLHKKPSDILLDNSWHYSAMKGIKDELKRGRPDLVHISILAAVTTPLYWRKEIDVYVHTINDHVITLGPNTSIPKSYHRFAGLVEKLFKEKSIRVGEKDLLRLEKKTFPELVDEIEPSRVIGLSTEGRQWSFEKIGSVMDSRSCVVIGGFQKGHFSKHIQNKISETYSAGDMSYDAHVVVSRLLYEYEKNI